MRTVYLVRHGETTTNSACGTKETAEIINGGLGVRLYQYPELNEQNCGDWEGQLWDVVLAEIEKYGENPPNGETSQEFGARINAAFVASLDQHAGTVLFVTHGGVIKALLSSYGYLDQEIENGMLHELELPGHLI